MTTRSKSILHALVIAVLSIIMNACTTTPYYTQYSNINNECWDSKDTLSFVLSDIEETTQRDLFLGIRTNSDFKYRELCTVVRVFDKQKMISSHTLSYDIYSAIGDQQGTGMIYSNNEKKVCPLNLIKGHTYTIKVYHIMRLSPLPGISNAYLRIE